jgi:subfamily B ATP-binding cassette protein HlyB/CyaB
MLDLSSNHDRLGGEFPADQPCATSNSYPRDTGLQCVSIIALLHGIAADEAELRHEFGHEPFTSKTILLAAKHVGLTAKLIKVELERLDRAALPAIAIDRDGLYCVLAKLEIAGPGVPGSRVLIQRPGIAPEVLALSEFVSDWSGLLIVFVSRATYAREMTRFDFCWFVPSIIKYRRLLGEVLLISLALQIIALATPVFFQVVMDKVLVNRAITTLDVIAVGLLCVIIFEAVLNTIRSYVFSHTTSKLDVELGARLFRHLLTLPIGYFHSRRVGDSVARIRELENIRSFLTGNALTVLLDLLFSFVFLGVMFWYSLKLTLIVAFSIPVYVVVSLIFTPVLRTKLDEKFNRGAESQSFLVETVGGIDTVKAMAIEPRWNQQWEKYLAAYVRSALSATNIGLMAGGAVRLASKLATLAIMWAGAWEVMDGNMTVGALIAFNMLSSKVASPVLRLAQLWNDFQQVGISMQRLGDILNTRTELLGRRTRLPRLEGAVEFEHVSFKYRPDSPLALRDVTLQVAPGELIGIVGRSGSGKSTLTKLIQRLYLPETGRILIDRYDLATADTASLRHQIGVVPQEGTLFNRSVRDNIALTSPGAPLQAVVAAAQLAGAHEFICDLPEGYDTMVGEHGTGLSGGQRQRIAIARSLMHDPRILILDEATSALDYESERAIQDGMSSICRGRTVLIVAHRLSAVRKADRIVVMDRGQVAELGSHDELVSRPGGIYLQLHRLQYQHGEAPQNKVRLA